MSKIAIFVDVQNIYYTTRDVFAKPFNYRKFWQLMAAKGFIVYANAYAIDRGDAQQQKFQSALKHIGFNVKLKPYISRADGSSKGDWDVGIAIDVMEIAAKVDQVILLSGDGDFDLLLQKVRDVFQVKTHVFSVHKLTAQSLIDASDEYTHITEKLLIN
ncbi:MAG: NYN domain-containing protein [Gammaproteobacteria bacterium]|nr:NYN domain-containing protein [Gammaproteobacteria bacterium]